MTQMQHFLQSTMDMEVTTSKASIFCKPCITEELSVAITKLTVLLGPKVAQHAGHHLHKSVIQRPEYKQGDITTALKQGFLEFDAEMQKDQQMRDELAGTTAITVLIKNNQLYCANVGDSRSVASVKGTCEPLSSGKH